MLTRTQICEQYSITSSTLTAVFGLLQMKPVVDRGRFLYEVNADDDFVLRCAKNHNGSFCALTKRFHLLPFHRFLCLRFLTTPIDEVHKELGHRHLVDTVLFTVSDVERLGDRFRRLMPDELRTFAEQNKEPTPELKDKFDKFLEVLDIDLAYEHPEFVDDFYQFTNDRNTKANLECALTTIGTTSQVQDVIEEVTANKWHSYAITIYKSLFYDLQYMDETNWSYYLNQLYPSEKNSKKRVRGKTTVEASAENGLRAHTQDVIGLVAGKMERRIMALVSSGTMEDFNNITHLIPAYLRLSVNTLNEYTNNGTGYFDNLQIATAKRVFPIVTGDKAAENK